MMIYRFTMIYLLQLLKLLIFRSSRCLSPSHPPSCSSTARRSPRTPARRRTCSPSFACLRCVFWDWKLITRLSLVIYIYIYNYSYVIIWNLIQCKWTTPIGRGIWAIIKASGRASKWRTRHPPNAHPGREEKVGHDLIRILGMQPLFPFIHLQQPPETMI